MAAENGRTNDPVAASLFEEYYRYEFFQAVRLLERLYSTRKPVGRKGKPVDEVVRFRSHPSLAHPPSQIANLEGDLDHPEEQPHMTVAFMGLIGPVGVLPYHYTQEARQQANDGALWDFLDIFTHRLVSLFYNVWERSRYSIAYERARHEGKRPDVFTRSLFAMVGLGADSLRQHVQLPEPSEGLLCYSGLLARQPRSVAAIETILSDYFAVSVRVEQCHGEWLTLEHESLVRLNSTKPRKLGIDTFIGEQVWDSQAKFRLRIGPLDYKRFDAFLPNGLANKVVLKMTPFLAGPELAFDIQLVLKAEDVPQCRLTACEAEQYRLGFTTWLVSEEVEQDSDQVLLTPD